MHRASVGLIALAALLAGSISAVDLEPAAKEYARRTVNKTSIAKSGASAAIGEIRNSPEEWGRGVPGFAKRVASSLATHAVKGAIHMTVAKIRHEELDYVPSGRTGFKPRLRYALLSTVITRKTTTGARTTNVSEISSAVGAGFISRAWQPVRLHTFASGVSSVGILFGIDAGSNVVREFWPEIRHPRRARQNAVQSRPTVYFVDESSSSGRN